MDWFGTGVLGSIFLILFLFIVPVQLAYADTIFSDQFEIDPELNEWEEKIVPQSPSGMGDIYSNNMDAVLLKTDGTFGVELSITRTIDTRDYDNISVKLSAFQNVNAIYEKEDFIRIEYDVGDGFVTILEDHQVWNGEIDDFDGEGFPFLIGNPISTPTPDLMLPEAASDNEFLKIKLTVFIDDTTKIVYFDNFDVNGDPLIIKEKDAFDLLDELFDLVNDLDPSEIENPGSLVSQAANLLKMLDGADKATHDDFIDMFHDFKDLIKEKLAKEKQESLESQLIENELDKMELKLKIQSSKILEEANKNNKIQTAVELGIQKKDLIKTKNQLAVAQFLPKSAEKDKLVEQLELEKIELLKSTLILDAKHNDKKITTDFLKKLDEKITEEKEGKKSQKDQNQDDKSNNSKKSDNNNKGNSSKSKSKKK